MEEESAWRVHARQAYMHLEYSDQLLTTLAARDEGAWTALGLARQALEQARQGLALALVRDDARLVVPALVALNRCSARLAPLLGSVPTFPDAGERP